MNPEVAIYRNVVNRNYITTPHLDIKAPNQTDKDIFVWNSSKIQNLCAIEFQIRNNLDRKLILIAI